MTNLLLLQYTCFLVSLLLAPIIIVSYFIQEGTNRRYERSRWMLVTAVLLLALHYFLQMRFSIRATTDTGATVVNILFYTPAAFLFSGSVLGLEGDRRRFRSYVLFGAMCTFLILLLFFIGWLRNGCLEMPYVQPIMHAVYFVVMTVFVLVPWKAIKRSRKRVINETGGDIVPYKRFVGADEHHIVRACHCDSLATFAFHNSSVRTLCYLLLRPLLRLSRFRHGVHQGRAR